MNQNKNQKKGENLFTRIAKSDNSTLNKVQDLFAEYGIAKAKDRFDLYEKLIRLCKRERDLIIPKLIEIHPDSKLFKAYYGQEIEQIKKDYEEQIKILETKLAAKEERMLADDGSKDKKDKPFSNEQISLIATLGVIGIFVLALSKK